MVMVRVMVKVKVMAMVMVTVRVRVMARATQRRLSKIEQYNDRYILYIDKKVKKTTRRGFLRAVACLQLCVYIIHKPVGVAVLGDVLADGLDLPAGQLVQIGEEGVGAGCGGVHLCQIHPLALTQQGGVYTAAADDPQLVLLGTLGQCQGGLGAGDDLHALPVEIHVAGDDDIAALGQGLAAGEGVQRLAAQDDGAVNGQGAEALHVRGQGEQQSPLMADGPVLVNNNDAIHGFPTSPSNGDRNFILKGGGGIALHREAGGGEGVEIRHAGVHGEFGGLRGGLLQHLLDDGHVAVVNVGVGDDVDQLAGHQAADLGEHMHQNGVLHHVPVVGGQHILGALVQNGVEGVAGDVERHGIGAGIQVHLVEVLEVVDVGENAAGGGIVLQVVQHPVHLVHVALGIVVLHAQLIAVGLADGAGLVGPGVPDFGVQVVDVVGLLLPDPQHFFHCRLPESPS